MRYQSETGSPGERHAIHVKVGNTAAILNAVSGAIARRACEIRQHRGSRLGSDQENWRLAESEILQPLGSCGILKSKEEAVISMFCSALGAKGIEEMEVCAEPHRLILVGRRRSGLGSLQDAPIYRVLPLQEEFDPSSLRLTLKQHGSVLEIYIHKRAISHLIEHQAA